MLVYGSLSETREFAPNAVRMFLRERAADLAAEALAIFGRLTILFQWWKVGENVPLIISALFVPHAIWKKRRNWRNAAPRPEKNPNSHR